MKLFDVLFVTEYFYQDNPESDLVTTPVLNSSLFCFVKCIFVSKFFLTRVYGGDDRS